VEVHEWLFWTLIAVALMHAAAAIYHHVFQHDATLARMLPRGWLRVPDATPPIAEERRDVV
jgi:cytochrome b561